MDLTRREEIWIKCKIKRRKEALREARITLDQIEKSGRPCDIRFSYQDHELVPMTAPFNMATGELEIHVEDGPPQDGS